MLDPPQLIHVELCIPNDILLQQSTWRKILHKNLSDTVEVWPYATIESFAPVKVITPTATGQIADVQTAAVAAVADTAHQPNWLSKELKHTIKNKTNGNPLPPGSPPLLIKTKHQHAHTLLVSVWKMDASDTIDPKNVYYAVRSTLKEALRLGYHRIALPVLDEQHIDQILDAITLF